MVREFGGNLIITLALSLRQLLALNHVLKFKDANRAN